MQAIETHYLGPTNTKGSRIVASIEGSERVITAYNTSLSNTENHARVAKLLLEKLHWTGTYVGGSTKRGMAWIFIDNQNDRI